MICCISVCLRARKIASSSTNISDFVLNLLKLNTLPDVLNRKGIPGSQSLNVRVRSAAKEIENIVGARRSPSFTPLSIAISPESWPLKVPSFHVST